MLIGLSTQLRRIAVVAALLALVSAPAALAAPLAEFVVYKTGDGQRLSALLFSAREPTRSVMIMVPGGTGGFISGAHDYGPLAERLTARGYALLLPNMRTAGRHGWLRGRWRDTVADVGAAVAFAKSRGLDGIVLFGTSLGGPRIAYYWAKTREPAVRALGFVAAITSPYGETEFRFDDERRAGFDAFLGRARALVAAGKGEELVSYKDWFPGATFTLAAASFIDYFGTIAESDASSVKWAPELTLPAVVIHGRDDRLAFPGNAEAIYASLTAASRRDLIWIESAGHYMTPGETAESYASAIAGWVLEVAPVEK